jgi:hypothetical protein
MTENASKLGQHIVRGHGFVAPHCLGVIQCLLWIFGY